MIAGEEAKPTGGPKPGSMSALLEELAEAPEVRPGTGIAPGTVIGGRFEVLRELGRGGFGVVFEARDRELGRLVAVKVVRARRGVDPGMLRAEAEAAAALHHPNIVTVHDLGSAGGEGWLVLELLRGETLEARLHRGALPGPEALRVATEIARGLAHAHRAGVLHRDLKPSNVFLCDDGAVKILDFGLSRVFGSGSGPEGGTPAYMAPEQWRRDAEDERTDVFALGVMLHEMLTGNRPFSVESGRSTALDDGPVPELPAGSAPRNVRMLVRRSMSRSRDDRPRDGAVVLESLLEQRTAAEAGRTRRRVVLAGALVGLVALVAFLASRALQVRDLAPGQRIPVAVADFQNGTSDPELNGLSGMLTTSLEQSKRLTVLTRSRLADLVRQTGKEVPDRIDESLAREVGKAAGVKALLLATVHRFDDVYAIEMRALDPATNEYLFTLKEDGKGKGEHPGDDRPALLPGARAAAGAPRRRGRRPGRRRRDHGEPGRLRALLQGAPGARPGALRRGADRAHGGAEGGPAVRAGPLPDGGPRRLDREAGLVGRGLAPGRAAAPRHGGAARRPAPRQGAAGAARLEGHRGRSGTARHCACGTRRPSAGPRTRRRSSGRATSASTPGTRRRRSPTSSGRSSSTRSTRWPRSTPSWPMPPSTAGPISSRWRAAGPSDPTPPRPTGRWGGRSSPSTGATRRLEAYAKATEKDGRVAYPPTLAHYLAYGGRAHEAEASVRAALAALPPPTPGEAAAPKDVVTAKVMTVAKERAGLHHTLVDLLVYQGRLREARRWSSRWKRKGSVAAS